MYSVNQQDNCIMEVKTASFSENNLKERQHLQEWIEKNTDVLGEDILIIQKEFAGFDNTKERLDLLGIDKEGNLVIIENKLDDSGKDVTWQALKYAAYCASLRREDIIKIYQEYLDNKKENDTLNAELKLQKFLLKDISELNNSSQRIILAAAKFRSEVIATVDWLTSKYGLKIKCIEVSLYKLEGTLYLDSEQIFPVKGLEEYSIKLRQKKIEDENIQRIISESQSLRFDFWKQLLQRARENHVHAFQHINPTKEIWLQTVINGINFSFGISNKYARVCIVIERYSKEINKEIFKKIYAQKGEIENTFGDKLNWEERPDLKSSLITYEKTDNANYFNKDYWEGMVNFMIDGMIRLDKAFKGPINNINLSEE